LASIKKILSYKNYLPVYLVVIIIFNVALINFPLTNVFSYEFSAVNAILLTFLSGLYTNSLLKKISNGRIDKSGLKKTLPQTAALFLILPAFISIINSFFSISCPLTDGMLFYLVITFPSVVIGFSLSLISSCLVKKFQNTIFVLLFLIILSIPLLEFYFNPQVYFYNPIFVYYPGTIYDEAVSVTFKLVGYRLLNILFFGLTGFFLFKALINKIKKLKKIVLALSIIVALLFLYLSPYFGYSTTFSKLKTVLKGTAVTEHFIIHYPPNLDRTKVKAIAVYHEYFYSQLKQFFGYDFPVRINSYLFKSNEQKENLFGSANADVAKPWQKSTFITYDDFSSILKHELAHCYSAEFGTGLFKVASGLNPALIEGCAVAADPVFNDNDIDYMASLAYGNGYKINLKKLFNSFDFYTLTSSLSYIYAGSFCKYLISNYGIEKFKIYYAGNNFKIAYGFPIETSIEKYYKYLKSLNITNRINQANYYYGSKSIFYKACPRYIAENLNKADKDYWDKDYKNAKKIFENILKVTNNYSAVIGYAECLNKLDKTNDAVKFLLKSIKQFKGSSYYYRVELKLGDLYSIKNNFIKADSIYKSLNEQNPAYNYNYLSSLRIALVKDSLAADYLKGNDFDKYIILKNMNSIKYNYNSIPVLIGLAESFNERYNIFLKIFNKKIKVTDFISSYSAFKLSDYMLNHLDFNKAEETALLALEFNAERNFEIILKNNFTKIEWFKKNADKVLLNTKIN
jgi:hypothetical protein